MKKTVFGLIIIFFTLCLTANVGESFPKIQEKRVTHNTPRKYAKEFAAGLQIPESPLEATHKLIKTLHNRELFSHVNRKDLAAFGHRGFSLQRYKNRLQMQISRAKNKKEKDKLHYSLDVLNTEYRVWEERYSKFDNRDWPFCLSGEEYIKYRITDGCTSFSKLFMTLANELGLYEDMRLLISKSFNNLKDNFEILGTDKLPTKTINGHQMVLAKWDGKWHLINVTVYKRRAEGEEKFEIVDKIDSLPITPTNILYHMLELPSMAENENLSKLVAAGIGKDRCDDLGIHNWEAAMGHGISIPREKFEALIKD